MRPPAGVIDENPNNNTWRCPDSDGNARACTFGTGRRHGRRYFSIAYQPFCYQPPGLATPLCPDEQKIATFDTLAAKLFPIPPANLLYLPLAAPKQTWTKPITKDTSHAFTAYLRKFYSLATRDYDQLAVWLPTIPLAEENKPAPLGTSDPRWDGYFNDGRVVWMQDRSLSGEGSTTHALALAHEIAHNLGRRHPNTADSNGAEDDDTDWPFANSTIQEVGYDPDRLRGVKPASLFDLMSYHEPAGEIWISPFTYRKLYESGLEPGRSSLFKDPARRAEATGELAIISGVARRDGSEGKLDPIYRVRSDELPPESVPGGNHCLRFYSAQARIGEYCFQLRFEEHRSRAVLDEEAFSLKVALPAGATRIALARGERELAFLTASPSAPVISITTPQSGDNWRGGKLTIGWSASDPDGDKLMYNVLYSADAGQSWLPLALDLDQTQYTFDPAEIDGGNQVFFRIMATDGFNTATADVGPVSIIQTPKVELIQNSIDFGNQLVGEMVEREFTLANTGSGPVTVNSIQVADSAFAAVSPRTPFTIPASSAAPSRFAGWCSKPAPGALA